MMPSKVRKLRNLLARSDPAATDTASPNEALLRINHSDAESRRKFPGRESNPGLSEKI